MRRRTNCSSWNIQTLQLDADEWIVRVSGVSDEKKYLKRLAFDTNKGRNWMVQAGDLDDSMHFFEMVGRDSEALYGFDAFVLGKDHTLYLGGLRPEWYAAPESTCNAAVCLERESAPAPTPAPTPAPERQCLMHAFGKCLVYSPFN